jgi:chromate reductase, NAD(P)H dehydrogenase (quinone)
MMAVPRILVLSGSTACDHPASRLADAAQLLMAQAGADVSRISLLDYPLPLMDTVPARRTEIPASAAALIRMLHHHDGLFFASPVVSRMPPPIVVNMIAWSNVTAGIEEPSPWKDGTVALVCTARSAEEASIATGCLRAAFESTGAHVVGALDMGCGLAEAFDEGGWIRDSVEEAALENLCTALYRQAADFRKAGSFA